MNILNMQKCGSLTLVPIISFPFFLRLSPVLSMIHSSPSNQPVASKWKRKWCQPRDYRSGHVSCAHQANKQVWIIGGNINGYSETEISLPEEEAYDTLYMSRDPFDSPRVLPRQAEGACGLIHHGSIYLYGGREAIQYHPSLPSWSPPILQFHRLGIPSQGAYGGRYATYTKETLIGMNGEEDLPFYRVEAGCLAYKNCMWMHGGTDEDMDWYRISLPQGSHAGSPELSLRDICKQVINSERNRHRFPLKLLKEMLPNDLLHFVVLF